MDSDFFWHTLGGGALITTLLALAHLILDFGLRGRERRREHAERHERRSRAAEARLERLLRDRLAESDRRLQGADAELRAERVRVATLEHDLLRVQHAYELLSVEYTSLLQLGDGRRTQR